MNKHDVIRHLKRFPDAINPAERLKSKAWQCCHCKNKLIFNEPATLPGQCPKCHSSIWITSHE